MRLKIDAAGKCDRARFVASPNADERPASMPIELIVVHNISLPPAVFEGDAVERLFTNRLDPNAHPYFAQIAHLRVSAHFFIRRDGEVIQFVEADRRAWHAGASQWRGRQRCNDFSVGIELEGTDELAYADAQYVSLAALIRALRRAYPTIVGVTGHEHIAPGRKTDPGPSFDWTRLRRMARLSHSMLNCDATLTNSHGAP
ncbi:MAG TPA: 1,6-anhydro-N-acetylmuramyl-L-alanine amidase AmpD [Burkholderiaceae bacterium]|nr:1,6-anhydro-N-acetylmuramyl-L-alanine amidase AmpD [Burkholderiaceae bacterium]